MDNLEGDRNLGRMYVVRFRRGRTVDIGLHIELWVLLVSIAEAVLLSRIGYRNNGSQFEMDISRIHYVRIGLDHGGQNSILNLIRMIGHI